MKKKSLWQRSQEIEEAYIKKILKKQKQKIKNELKKCTFKPLLNYNSVILATSPKFDSNFYTRSCRWKKDKEKRIHQKR